MSQVLVTPINKLRALHDSVLVTEMSFDERKTSSGIVIPTDDGRDSGIRPRWAQIYAVGPEQRDVQVGQWVLVAHGRWTRGIKIDDHGQERVVRRVDNDDILLVTEERPTDETMSDKV
jgi:co-chaperonin GroES (HSP10)